MMRTKKNAKQSNYIRDGRAPIPKKKITSIIMSKIRAKNTKPEVLLRKALIKNGIRTFSLHIKNLPGKPDICFKKRKLAIFVNGCYWHRCPKCKPKLPKTHKSFWNNKFKANVLRDEKKNSNLKKMGYRVITIWECQIKENIKPIIVKISKSLKRDVNR